MSSELSKNTLEQAALIVEALAPLLIRSGVGYTEFASACKPAFYRSAINEAQRTGQKQTDSSISLLSGLHRRDTASMRKAVSEDLSLANSPISKPVSVPKQVIARWLSQDIGDTIPITNSYSAPQDDTQHDYISPDACPQDTCPQDKSVKDDTVRDDSDIHLSDSDNQVFQKQEVSFSDLVSQVSKDQHFRSILTELERIGIVEVNDRDVKLKRSAFTPDPHLNEARELLSQNVSDHISAGIYNLFIDTDTDNRGLLEQAIFSDELTKNSIDELHELSNKLWFDTLNTVLKRAIELYERDKEVLANHKSLQSLSTNQIDGSQQALFKCMNEAETNNIDTYRFRLGMYAYHERE